MAKHFQGETHRFSGDNSSVSLSFVEPTPPPKPRLLSLKEFNAQHQARMAEQEIQRKAVVPGGGGPVCLKTKNCSGKGDR